MEDLQIFANWNYLLQTLGSPQLQETLLQGGYYN